MQASTATYIERALIQQKWMDYMLEEKLQDLPEVVLGKIPPTYFGVLRP